MAMNEDELLNNSFSVPAPSDNIRSLIMEKKKNYMILMNIVYVL